MNDGRKVLERSIADGKLSASLLSLDDLGPAGSMEPDDLEDTVICFEYADDAGDTSDRWVTIHRVDSEPPAKLECYCWMRKMSRTFRADRVSSVSDMNGEVWTGREFFAVFGIDSHAKPKRRSRLSIGLHRREEPSEQRHMPQKLSDELPEWKRHLNDVATRPKTENFDPTPKEETDQPTNVGCLITALTLLTGIIYSLICLSIGIPVLVVALVLFYSIIWR